MHMITHQGQVSSHRTEGETSGHACNQQGAHPAHSLADAGRCHLKVVFSQHNS